MTKNTENHTSDILMKNSSIHEVDSADQITVYTNSGEYYSYINPFVIPRPVITEPYVVTTTTTVDELIKRHTKDMFPKIEELINGAFKDYSIIDAYYSFEDDQYRFEWVGNSDVCVVTAELLSYYEWGEFKDNKLLIVGGFMLRAQARRDNGDVIFFRQRDEREG